ncbi:hypothetical protein [Candidatus Electronema sp. PJ]|uniref:hypothetical protein n=1 Tax=Candidatus Electronema sp. PJ TaxID=3401572 RepID=UPI003AA9D25E
MSMTFEQVVETAKRFPVQQQEMLADLIRGWLLDARRKEIAHDAKKSLADFRCGQFAAQSAESVIAELRALSVD